MGEKVKPAHALGSLEQIVEEKAKFEPTGLDGVEILPVDGFKMDFNDAEYKDQFIKRLNDRVGFLTEKQTVRGGFDKLSGEAVDSIKHIANQASKL